jgi:hypothetical protein
MFAKRAFYNFTAVNYNFKMVKTITRYVDFFMNLPILAKVMKIKCWRKFLGLQRYEKRCKILKTSCDTVPIWFKVVAPYLVEV